VERRATAAGSILLAALCALSLSVAATAPAAKKKCKGKKVCNKSKTFQRVAGHSLRLTTSTTPPGSVRYDFCRGGGYGYRAVSYDGTQQVVTTYHGYWRVVSSQGSAGVIQYTVKGFSSTPVNGFPAEEPPPSPIAKTITFGPFGIYFDGVLFNRGKARCK
jgi:hypothetical protein